MGVSIRTLRRGLMIGAVALVAAVAGFIGYGRLRFAHFVTGLPKRLGADIRQETNGFTWSQAVGGRTVFTIHAAKEVQRTNGVVTLHDVGIVLYGKDGKPTDRIHGQEFEYNQATGVMRGVGEVFLDLTAPDEDGQGADSSRVLHVKTSGLEFRQKERVAETNEGIEFAAQGYSGQAVGAVYDSARGVVVLKSAVRMSGLKEDKPVVLTASRLELDKNESVAKLEGARYTTTGEQGAESAAADHAVVTMEDNQPRRVQGEGHVVLTGGDGGRVTGDRVDLTLVGKGVPERMHLWGQVRGVSESADGHETGQAEDARVSFDRAGQARQVVLTKGVRLEEISSKGDRVLRGDVVEMELAGTGKVVLRQAKAQGEAGVRGVAPGKDGGQVVTEMTGRTLTAGFAGANVVQRVNGEGGTKLERTETDAKGRTLLHEVSRGDRLTAGFVAGKLGRAELAEADQDGGVSIHREAVAKKAGAPVEVDDAKSASAHYDAATDTATLRGGVVVEDATGELLAETVVLNRKSGEATANGDVRTTYAGEGDGKQEPVHVAAARAVAHKSTGVSEFYGDAARQARMWQGGSQVLAPVIVVDRMKKTVTASGGVTAMLPEKNGQVKPDTAKKGAKQAGMVRVTSRTMVYVDATREATLEGGVTARDADGTMQSAQAVVTLSAPEKGKTAAVSGLMGGKVERMVGTGNVVVQQPGRRATGERLVYTAEDGVFVLTGTKAAPPRMTDEQNGTTTGAALRFKSGDETVTVEGADGDGKGRVKTEAHVRGRNGQ